MQEGERTAPDIAPTDGGVNRTDLRARIALDGHDGTTSEPLHGAQPYAHHHRQATSRVIFTRNAYLGTEIMYEAPAI